MPDPKDIKSLMGESRGMVEFLLSFASKSVAAFALVLYFLLTYAMDTIASQWPCGVALFGLSTVLTCWFLFCESWKKVNCVKSCENGKPTQPPIP